MGENAERVREPLLVYLPVARRPDAAAQTRQAIEHKAGVRELTALRVYGPHVEACSAAMQAAGQTGAVGFRPSPEHFAEIGFNGEHQGGCADLRPALPLVLCW